VSSEKSITTAGALSGVESGLRMRARRFTIVEFGDKEFREEASRGLGRAARGQQGVQLHLTDVPAW
jgi:hypothetical protein